MVRNTKMPSCLWFTELPVKFHEEIFFVNEWPKKMSLTNWISKWPQLRASVETNIILINRKWWRKIIISNGSWIRSVGWKLRQQFLNLSVIWKIYIKLRKYAFVLVLSSRNLWKPTRRKQSFWSWDSLRESLESILMEWGKIYIFMKNRNMVYVQGSEWCINDRNGSVCMVKNVLFKSYYTQSFK